MRFLAKWIGNITDETIGSGTKDMVNGSPASYFRKEFTVKKDVKNAELTATSLGLYYTYINGMSTDDELFKPQWSDYNQTIDYKTYDVTSFLHVGKNCVGAILGDGWYSGKISIIGRQLYGGYPLQLFLQLRIEYSDGEEEYICSDESFTAGTGNIRENDFQNGEKSDNNFATVEFSCVDFDDSGWISAQILPSKSERLKESVAPPICYHEVFAAKFLHLDGDGRRIYDIGQNLAGNISIDITANKNDKIIFRFGEMLKADGSLYTENLRSALATDTLISGGKKEHFQPLFTFHGFRYIEIDAPQHALIENVVAKACYSDIEEKGKFDCDNSLVNQIFKNSLWGQKSNFVGLPTDCPQRDERMGWTGDLFAFCGTSMFNMNCKDFYKKVMNDMVEAQRPDGAITDVVPYVPVVGYGNNGWGDAATEMPYTYYLMYGDKNFVREYLPAMKKWVDYQKQNSIDLIRQPSGYGDWLSIRLNETNVMAMNTAMFAHSANIVAKLCTAIGDNDSEKYACLFEDIKKSYNREFVNGTKIANDAQGDYLLASAMGLVDVSSVKDGLVKAIKDADNHLSCGFMSIKYLLPILCETNEVDLAYELISKDTYPSWGYSIRQGATTMWERWNSYTIENGFGDVSMNSFNHYSFGSCTEWLYRYVLGINPTLEGAGFEKCIIRPFVDFSGRINNARGEFDSIKGKISVEWKVENDICTFTLASQLTPNSIELDFNRYKVVSNSGWNTVNIANACSQLCNTITLVFSNK